ncbi:unnamed protein product [Brachionus calyciflorus]|uniref:Multiple inositol polyphosphate phosphatase 1 n=1 Tax=Brachionus calyciflorus TaxID=104777 RepID=A0A813V1B3_9BILA|nr:unnamed protein product [Brachionus calyciflorus]
MSYCLSIFFILITISALCIKKSFEIKHSTKTAYLDSFSDEQLKYINNIENYKIENCSPEQIYIFLRHGSRYPNSKYVRNTEDFLNKVKVLRREQAEKYNVTKTSAIDEIFLTFHDKPHHGLSDLGAFEMYDIGQRFKKRYPNLFSNDEKDVLNHINIVSSDRDRSIDSGKNFVNGVFGKGSRISEYVNNNFILNNTLIRYFDECERYLVDVKKKKKSNEDLVNFIKGHEMTRLLSNFKTRNHIQELNFETKILYVIFGLCGIEHAHRMERNWCKLFENDEELEILSYLSDLKDYWIKSYGNIINYQVVQYIFKDLFTNLDMHIKNHPKRKKVLLRFGHAENIIPLVSVLSLFKDPFVLKYDKFNQVKDRLFKTAIMSPFASNVAFVLHKCNQTDEMYKVKILVNELPLHKIRAGDMECNKENTSMCNLNSFRSLLNEYLNVDLEQSCTLNKNLNLEL